MTEDGQLHTLGLLERLRTEAGRAKGVYAGVHERVDVLLRELANSNLHDIANMSFRVDLWDRHAKQIRRVIAAAGNVFIAQAAFDAAVTEWSHEHFALRHGIRRVNVRCRAAKWSRQQDLNLHRPTLTLRVRPRISVESGGSIRLSYAAEHGGRSACRRRLQFFPP
jgi:hypothetical protein